MKKRKNYKIFLIVGVVILVILSFLIGQFLASQNITFFRNQTNNNINQYNKIDDNKEIVYTKENYVPENLPEDLNSDEVRTELPFINLDSNEIKKINSNIEEEYNKLKDENIVTKDMTNINSVKYKYYVNNNILSLVIEYKSYNYTAGYVNYEYKTYNINTDSSSEITNDELMKIKNTNNEEVYNKLLNSLEKEYENLGYDDYKNTDFYKETIGNIKKNDKINIPLFLDNDNKLNAYLNIRMNMGPGTIARNFVLK